MPAKAVAFLAAAVFAVALVSIAIVDVAPYAVSPPPLKLEAGPIGTPVPDEGVEDEGSPTVAAATTTPLPPAPSPSIAASTTPVQRWIPATPAAYSREEPSGRKRNKAEVDREQGRAADLLGHQGFKVTCVDGGRLVAALPSGCEGLMFRFGGGRSTVLAVAASDVGGVTLWNPDSAEALRRLVFGPSGQTSVDLSPGSAGLSSYSPRPFLLAFQPGQDTLAVGTHDGYLIVWPYGRDGERQVLTAFSDAVRSIAFSPDGEWLAFAGGSSPEVIQLARCVNSHWCLDDTVEAKSPHLLYFGPKARDLTFGSGTTLWKLAAGSLVAAKVFDYDRQAQVYWNSVATFEKTVLLQDRSRLVLADLGCGKVIRTFKFWKNIKAVAMDSSGCSVAVFSGDEFSTTLSMMGAGDERPQTLLATMDSGFGVHRLAFSPDGTWLASQSGSGKILVWRIRD